MTFLNACEGELIPMCHITGARYISETLVEVSVTSGVTHEAPASSWELAKSAEGRQIVPAAGGTYLLTYGRFDGRLRIDREPIVAWAIETAGVTPVTEKGMSFSGSRERAILYSDGTVHDALGLHDSFRSWIGEVGPGEVLNIDSGRSCVASFDEKAVA